MQGITRAKTGYRAFIVSAIPACLTAAPYCAYIRIRHPQVILKAVDQPKKITIKTAIDDIVTETDKASEVACVAAIQAAFPE